jgi:hypothetical protein
LCPVGRMLRGDTKLKCVQHGGNVVDELCAGNRRRGG